MVHWPPEPSSLMQPAVPWSWVSAPLDELILNTSTAPLPGPDAAA